MNRRTPGIAFAFTALLSLGCSEAGAPRLVAPGMASESKAAGGKPSSDPPIRWEIPFFIRMAAATRPCSRTRTGPA